MAMVNLGNISAVTTQMLGNDLGGAVASGVSTLLQSGGENSLSESLAQLEKFFGPQGPGRVGGNVIASGPAAFSTVSGPNSGVSLTPGVTNPFGSTQGLQPKMQGMIEGLNQTLGDMLETMGSLGDAQRGLSQAGPSAGGANLAQQFEMVMDQAIKLHLSGAAGDGIKAQALFQKALGMLSGPSQGNSTTGMAGTSFSSGTVGAGGSFGMPSGGSGAAGFGGGAGVSGGFTSSGGGGISAAGGGLDAMMSQAESLLRSDSMEAQLAGQRLMQKALRMFELISKLIEKQSEMASKAIAAIK